MSDLAALIARVEAATGADNTLDVEIEIALFEPSKWFASIRSNNTGTKVTYTMPDGGERTHWAWDWSMHTGYTIAALKARQP